MLAVNDSKQSPTTSASSLTLAEMCPLFPIMQGPLTSLQIYFLSVFKTIYKAGYYTSPFCTLF